jgi:hypothetical protein
MRVQPVVRRLIHVVTRRRPIAATSVALCVAALSACGTTVPGASTAAAGTEAQGLQPAAGTAAGAGSGLGAAAGGPAGAGAGATVSGGGAGTAAGQALAGGGATSTAAGTTVQGPAASTSLSVPGITDKTVTVGIVYFNTDRVNDLSAASGGGKQGDSRTQERAVAAWINKHGGVIGGRKIVLVEHEMDISSSPSVQAQALCSAMAEDHHVYAVLTQAIPDNSALDCFEKKHILSVSATVATSDQQDFDRYPDTYSPTSLELNAATRATVAGLSRAGWFTKDAKIGVLGFDVPAYRRAFDKALVPALKAVGHKADDQVWATYSDLQHYGDTLATIQAAVLRFRSNGITHVMFFDLNGVAAHYFMTQAENQGYKPVYGLNSNSSPGTLSGLHPTQMPGAAAVGWMPEWDVTTLSKPYNPAAALCQQIMVEAGQAPQSASDGELQHARCSQFFMLRDVLARAKSFDTTGFRAAAESLSDNPDSAAHGLSDGYGPRKHWGARVYRDVIYSEGCNCWKYGAEHPIGS